MSVRPSSPNQARFLLRVGAVLVLIAAVLGAVALGRAPRWLGLWYLALGIASAVAYGWDKHRAKTDGWRVKESSLTTIDLFGGIIGGLLAQVGFHHKTSKPDFAFATGTIVVIHLCGLVAQVTGLFDLIVRLS